MCNNWVLFLSLICLIYTTSITTYYKKSYIYKICNTLLDIADTMDYISNAIDDINDRTNDIERKLKP